MITVSYTGLYSDFVDYISLKHFHIFISKARYKKHGQEHWPLIILIIKGEKTILAISFTGIVRTVLTMFDFNVTSFYKTINYKMKKKI